MVTPRLSDMADDELLARFATGEAAAFEVLLRRYQRPLYNFILRSVRDTEVAADLLQDTFTRVLQHGSEWNGSAKFSTWVYVIARNLCIDHARRMRHRRHASLDGPARAAPDGDPLVERIAAQRPDTEREAAGPDLRARIERAVEALPEEQREVFLMRQIQQMPFAEIAAVVVTSENTVKSRMLYALTRLQDALIEYEEQARARVS